MGARQRWRPELTITWLTVWLRPWIGATIAELQRGGFNYAYSG